MRARVLCVPVRPAWLLERLVPRPQGVAVQTTRVLLTVKPPARTVTHPRDP